LEPLEKPTAEPTKPTTESKDKTIETPPPPPINTPQTQAMNEAFAPSPSQKQRKGPINIQLAFPPNPIRFWNLAEFDAVLPVLREKKWVESTEWDIKASIRQTIRSGGMPKFVLKQKRQTPQYLMLIEQQSNRDHLAAFYADLAEELSSRDLNVTYYYYDITPAVCWRERNNPRTHVPLEQLQGEYADARLFIVGNAETLLKTTQLEPSAVAMSIWETWKETAVLSPKGTGDWGRGELAIGQLFPVIPANGLGFQSLSAQWQGTEHFTPTYWQLKNPEPRTPNVADFIVAERQNGENTEGSLSLPSWKTITPEDENHLNLLYFYLRDGGYRWLCAAALYPEIYYELTRLYADEVIAKDQALSEWAQNQLWGESLRLLLRLDWFRKGQIPTHFRGLLRDDFSIERALVLQNPQFELSVKEVRRQLLEVLKLPQNTEGVPEDSYAAANQAFTQVWIESEMANNLADIPQKMEKLQISMSDIEDAVGQQLWFLEGQKLEQNKDSGSIKTLYALIIAIDKYPIKQHELFGCVNDATAIANYLKEFARSEGLVYSEKRLFDSDAKRENIVASFNHFEKAQNGDVCVCYFAGHGSTMKAPPEPWHDELNSLSNTLVCFDSRANQTGSRDLADKEIGHLIHKATKNKDIHFLFITDCSNSEDNTRKLSSERNFRTRTLETCPTAPQTINEYEGFKEWINFQPSPSNHIHLSAVQRDETANELKIEGTSRGVFTYALIDTLLQTLNNINYSELVSRLRIKVRNRVQNQTPSCNAYGSSDMFQLPFLGHARSGVFIVSYSEKENSWVVNAGIIQRLPIEGGTEFGLENGMKVITTEVRDNFSKVNLELPPAKTVFDAQLISPINMVSTRFRLAISSDSDVQGATYLKNYFQQKGDADLQLQGNEYDTDYVARLSDGALRLTMVNQTQPLFKKVKGYSDDSVKEFLDRSVSVARWRSKLELSNPNIEISDKDIEIQFYDSYGKPTNELVFRQPNSDTEVNLQISITNRSKIPLYISAVYFGADFSVSNQFLRSKQIQSGETIWVEYDNNKNIPFFVQQEYLSWGVNELEEYFKFFVSKNKLDTNSLNQEGLPLDSRTFGASRAIQYNTKEFSLSNWRTFERSFHIISPFRGVALNENQEKNLDTIKISTPVGFSAKIAFTTTVDAKRTDPNLTNQRFGNYLIPVALVEGMANSPIVDALEIDYQGALSKENPLQIEMPPYQREGVVAMGYDVERGVYLPIGTQNTEGVIIIEQLPPLTNMSKTKIFFRRANNNTPEVSQ
jgi:Caspase domain